MSPERPPDFYIEEDAGRYIVENGGRVFIWSQSVLPGAYNALKISLAQPALEHKTFTRYRPEDGIEVYVDGTISFPARLWWSPLVEMLRVEAPYQPHPPKFQIDTRAARFIQKNGGRVYIWAEAFGRGGYGTVKTSLDEPSLEDTTFIRFDQEGGIEEGGIEVFVDETIAGPRLWWLSYQRVPHRQVRAQADPPSAPRTPIGWWLSQ